MRYALSALVVLVACSGQEKASKVAVAPAAPPPAAVAGPPAPMASASAAPVASAAPAPATPPPPKVVLQLGDSMVGGYNALAKALAPRFEALGAHFVRDWQDSVDIGVYDREHRIQDLLKKHSPDLVLVTLGANDVTIPSPWVLAKNVASIARKVSEGGRACYWLTPPLWTKDTGIIEVIHKNAAPCKVFDASYLKVSRIRDGIHPSDKGGETWAEAFFAFYNGTGPAVPNAPADKIATR